MKTATGRSQQQAVETGQANQDQLRGMSAEQKAAFEKQLKEHSESIKKNKALNDEFNAGKTAMDAKDYATAEQHSRRPANSILARLRSGSSLATPMRTGPKPSRRRRTKATYDKAAEAYKKALAIKPDDAALYNQLGNVYGAAGKIPEATEALTKAANSTRKWRPRPTTTWAPTW